MEYWSIQSEICIISYPLPVTGHHLSFLTNPHVRQSFYLSFLVARKRAYSRWDLVTVLYRSWEIRYATSTSDKWLPCLISDIPERRTVFPLVFCVAWPRKHGYSRWDLVAIMYRSWDIRYLISTSGYWPPSPISGLSGRRTVFPLVSSCCPTPKTWALPSRSCCYHV